MMLNCSRPQKIDKEKTNVLCTKAWKEHAEMFYLYLGHNILNRWPRDNSVWSRDSQVVEVLIHF